MKKEYTKPSIEVIKLDLKDIITLSLGQEKVGDTKKGWNTLA